jgi:predicted anti-sigma-YlaC factor YlaD
MGGCDGNFAPGRNDQPHMNCEIAREALSAQLDGERPTCPLQELEEHVAGCAACQQWREAAHVVTRRVRLNSAPMVSDRTADILAAVLADQATAHAERHRPRRDRARRFVRAGLVATALGQFAIILPAFIGHAGAGVPPHASRELGAFNLALAAGFLAAAVRPALVRGMTLLVGTATATLLLLSVVDSAVGSTTIGAETPHLITLAGWLLLHGLARAAPSGSNGTGGAPARPGRLRRLGILGRGRWYANAKV